MGRELLARHGHGQHHRSRFLVGLLAVVLSGVAVTVVAPPAASAQVGCSSRTLAFAAHEDDDTIFSNPDLMRDMDNGACVRIVFVTAGEAGRTGLDGILYMLGRETGAKASMLAFKGQFPADPGAAFSQSSLAVPNQAGVGLYTMNSDPRLSIAFMRLHDGFQLGSLHPESIYKLWLGQIATSCTLPDPANCYSRQGLINAMGWMMNEFQPNTIRVQDLAGDPVVTGDHPDHHASAYFANAAQQTLYAPAHTTKGYRGYTTSPLPQNVFGADLTRKQDAFDSYAEWDAAGLGDPNDPQSGYQWITTSFIPKQYLATGGEVRGYVGKCMDVEGPSTNNGTAVQIWTCLGVAQQQWVFSMGQGGTGTVRGFGNKCLTAPANAGSDVTMWDCSGGANQNWNWTTSGELRQGERCVDVRGPSTADGTNLQTYPCYGVIQQHWGVGTVQPAGIEVHGIGGKCLDVEGPSTADGTAIQIYNCVGGSQQQWVYDSPSLQVRGLAGKCLTQSGSNVVLWTCGLGGSQQWQRTVDSYLRNNVTGQCIDIPNPIGDGVNLTMYTCGGGGAKQKWAFASFVTATIRPIGNTSVCLGVPNVANGTDATVGSCTVNATWTFTSSYREIRLGGACLDVEGGGTADGTKAQVWGCSLNGHPNERWRTEGYYIRWDSTLVNKCVTTVLGAVGIWNCAAYPTLQQWVYI